MIAEFGGQVNCPMRSCPPERTLSELRFLSPAFFAILGSGLAWKAWIPAEATGGRS